MIPLSVKRIVQNTFFQHLTAKNPFSPLAAFQTGLEKEKLCPTVPTTAASQAISTANAIPRNGCSERLIVEDHFGDGGMVRSDRKYTSFYEMKADEYRYWQSRPMHERVNAVSELNARTLCDEGRASGCTQTFKAQRAWLRAANQDQNSLSLWAGRFTPRLFCACSLEGGIHFPQRPDSRETGIGRPQDLADVDAIRTATESQRKP